MAMCPYCGEDVADDAKNCWKCGTELAEVDEAEREVIEQAEQELAAESVTERKPKRKVPKRQCPFCETMVPMHSLRCNRCGKELKPPTQQVEWPRIVKGAAATGAGMVVLGLTIYLVMNFGWGERAIPVLQVDYEPLERYYLRSSGAGSQDRDMRRRWDFEHKGKYVEWTMVILEIEDARAGTLLLAESTQARKDRPEVRLILQSPELLKADPEQRPGSRDLKEGLQIRYKARLKDFKPHERLLVLDDGEIQKFEN